MSAKPDPAELLSLLVAIARSGARSHISSEFKRCADSSVGSTDSANQTFSQTQTAPSSGTSAFIPPVGHPSTAKHIEDEWWVPQNSDASWIRQWDTEEEYDSIDPKRWK